MAITASAAGGKWSETTAWEGGKVPGEADDVILGAGSGSITIEAVASCRSLDCSSYTKTLTINKKLSIGTTTSNAGLCVKFGASMTLAGNGEVFFVSTSGTVEKITMGGKAFGGYVEFNGVGGKWEFLDKFESTANERMFVHEGEVKTGGQEVVVGGLTLNTAGATIVLGKSIVKLKRTSGEVLRVVEGTWSMAEATFEVMGTGAAEKKVVGGSKLSCLVFVVAAQNVVMSGANTFGTLKVNTAAATKTCKATLTGASNHLVPTEGEENLEAGVEVTGTAIPAGTVILKKIEAKLWEMSANASETVAVPEAVTIYSAGLLLAEGTTQTVTTAFTTNGKAGELARLASTVSGKFATLTGTAGGFSVNFMRLKDSHANTAQWYAGTGSTNVSGNEGWLFTAAKYTQALAAASKPTAALLRAIKRFEKAIFKPTGLLGKLTARKLVTAVFQPVGALAKLTERALVGAGFKPVGLLSKRPEKILEGTFKPTGLLGGREIARALAAIFKPSGQVSRLTLRSLIGAAFKAAGELIGEYKAGAKEYFKELAATFTPTGLLAKQPRKTLAAVFRPSGIGTPENPILDPSFEYDTEGSHAPPGWSFSGGAITAGAVGTVNGGGGAVGSKYLSVVCAGAAAGEGVTTGEVVPYAPFVEKSMWVYIRGTVGGKVEYGLAGAGIPTAANFVTLTGSWQRVKIPGTFEPAGLAAFFVRNRNAGEAITIEIDAVSPTQTYFDGDTPGYAWTGTPGNSRSLPTATLSKQPQKTLNAVFGPTGLLNKLTGRQLPTAVFKPSGSVTKRPQKNLEAGLKPTGALGRATQAILNAVFAPTGALSRLTSRALNAVFKPTGSLNRASAKELAASFKPSGNLAKLTSRALEAIFAPVGGFLAKAKRRLRPPTRAVASFTIRVVRLLTSSQRHAKVKEHIAEAVVRPHEAKAVVNEPRESRTSVKTKSTTATPAPRSTIARYIP